MDPITQGALGAILPLAMLRGSRAKNLGAVGLTGALAAMSPDLDVLIRSSTDPLLALEYHRQFTHSLFFVPVGALLCALVLHRFIGRRNGFSFTKTFVVCALGYGTHALLDACTTYGTQLFWPFGSLRVAWNLVAVIDPLYTLPILVGIAASIRQRSPKIARLILLWIVAYPALGYVQQQRVEAVAHRYLEQELGEQAGQSGASGEPGKQAAKPSASILSIEAKPSLGNIVLWKIIIETEDEYLVDAIRLGPFQSRAQARIYRGDRVKKFRVEEDLPWLEQGTQQALDVERFRWFSDGFIALDPSHANRLIDIRYSMLPNEINALWSIELNPEAGPREHVEFLPHRDMSPDRRKRFLSMLFDT